MDFLERVAELGNAFIEKQVSKRSPGKAATPNIQPKLEHLYGCAGCNFSEGGCKACWEAPFATRPAARAKPEGYRWQHDLPDAPTFRPTLEQFNDPFAYLSSIAAEAAAGGIALIIPPPEWQPPIQMLDQETGQLRKDFKVPVRIQPTHLLCRRYPTPAGAPPVNLSKGPAAAAGRSSERFTMKFGSSADGGEEEAAAAADRHQVVDAAADAGDAASDDDDAEEAAAAAPMDVDAQQQQQQAKKQQQQAATAPSKQKRSNAVTGRCSKTSMQQQKAAIAAAAAAVGQEEQDEEEQEQKEAILNPAHLDAVATAAAATDGQFGYEHLEDPLSLHDFHRYADWAKRRHFRGPLMAGLSKRQQQQQDAAAAAAAAAAGNSGGGGGSSSGRGAASNNNSSSSMLSTALTSLPVNAASNAWRCHPASPATRAARGIRGKWLPGTGGSSGSGGGGGGDDGASWCEPDILEVEAEFWRIVEAADEQVEALYGQDVDTATYSSAFPTIKELAVEEAKSLLKPGRSKLQHQKLRKLLAAQHQQQVAAAGSSSSSSSSSTDDPSSVVDEEPAMSFPTCGCGQCQLCNLRQYTGHPWNINNIPQATGSVLRFVREDVGGKPITGLMVPWLYVGSCFSAFCWHIEDHGLYSVNYNHMGAPKIWYGVPATAAAALEASMRDALPHLFAKDKLLLHKLVTMLSPNQLRARGVPVCRAVQIPGSFVVTFPDAYHAGFNSGFNVAEAVNFAAPDWLPFGSSSVVRYRCESRYMTFSHDQMLINVVRDAAIAAAAAAAATTRGEERAIQALPAPEQQQQPGSAAKPLRLRKQQHHPQKHSLKAVAAAAAAAATAKAAAEQAVLQPAPLFGLRAQFAAGLEATLQSLAAAEELAVEQHWHQKQQQHSGLPEQPSAVAAAAVAAAAAGSEAAEEEYGGVRFVAPPTGLVSAAVPAVVFSSSPTDSSFWWDWYSSGSWAEAAQVADESAALCSRLREQHAEQQQEQHHEHHAGLGAGQEKAQQHHLAAASAQHHQGQRERVFTMRGAAAGPAAAAATAAAAGGSSGVVVSRAAKAFTAAAFGSGLPAQAATGKGAAGAAAAASVAEQQNTTEAVVSAITAYIMQLADARRSQLLMQPPRAPLARSAVGELALRLELEQQRQQALVLQAGISRIGLMQGTAAAVDPRSGVHINTQGVECSACGCDLSLAAVVSDADPGRAVCPAHYLDLDGTRSEWQLLLRYAPGQLDRLLAAALKLVPGAAESVQEARKRYNWVAAGRFMGGTVLQKPPTPAAAAAVCEGNSQQAVKVEAAAAAAESQPQQQQQQQQEQQPAAVVVVAAAGGVVRQQQPVVEVMMLGKLYEPDQLSSKLFEDLEELAIASISSGSGSGSSSSDDDGGGGRAASDDDDDYDGASAGEESDADDDVSEEAAAGSRRGQHRQQQQEDDSSNSGGEDSSGSWWEAELDGSEDAFGFYTFGGGKRGRQASMAEDTSDDDFKPTRATRRKRRRGGGAAMGPRKRAAVAAASAVPVKTEE